MGRLRAGFEDDASSSSEEEDAFASLSKKGKNGIAPPQKEKVEASSASLPNALTSSMKRHHKENDQRKAKMDALLIELEAEKRRGPKESKQFVPNKKGSFVERGEEHVTTNIFIGNLDPSITEEQLTELFLQFGELHSIKIMWPRTQAERIRSRNTGFVCFMRRQDAEEAMDACSDTDPFHLGRNLMLRWGKDIRNKIQRGTGGNPNLSNGPAASKRDDSVSRNSKQEAGGANRNGYTVSSSINFKNKNPPAEERKAKQDNPKLASSAHQTRVVIPRDPRRYQFITTVASFVAADGSQFEQRLLQKQNSDSRFSFLTPGDGSEEQREEFMFYRWRVYAFCQADSFSTWQTGSFEMLDSVGTSWIPPSADEAPAHVRYDSLFVKPTVERMKFATGRQLERARAQRDRHGNKRPKTDGGELLSSDDVEEFRRLTGKNLSLSRESICQAMAFCFEKSLAAGAIVGMLRDLLLETDPRTNVDMRIARLFLISDVLYNSQQPGIRNAFVYRDSIEKMAPDVFESLGRLGGATMGRLSKNKLQKAVLTVLGAWTEWSVYNPVFMDDLQRGFEGKPAKTTHAATDMQGAANDSCKQHADERKIKLKMEMEDAGSSALASSIATDGHASNKISKEGGDKEIPLVGPASKPRPFISEAASTRQKEFEHIDQNERGSGHHHNHGNATSVSGENIEIGGDGVGDSYGHDKYSMLDDIDGEPLDDDEIIEYSSDESDGVADRP